MCPRILGAKFVRSIGTFVFFVTAVDALVVYHDAAHRFVLSNYQVHFMIDIAVIILEARAFVTSRLVRATYLLALKASDAIEQMRRPALIDVCHTILSLLVLDIDVNLAGHCRNRLEF